MLHTLKIHFILLLHRWVAYKCVTYIFTKYRRQMLTYQVTKKRITYIKCVYDAPPSFHALLCILVQKLYWMKISLLENHLYEEYILYDNIMRMMLLAICMTSNMSFFPSHLKSKWCKIGKKKEKEYVASIMNSGQCPWELKFFKIW